MSERSLSDGVLVAKYRNLVDAGELQPESNQHVLVRRLDELLCDIDRHRLAHKKSALGWLFSSKKPSRSGPRGVYIWGGVGRGKSMLMDMFFDALPDMAKRRVHFHAFMADVHERIFAHRQAVKSGKASQDDPIPPVADQLSDEAKLLCFDEFAVTDVADAMILARLFSALFERGVSVVATSNVHPDNLYRHGLNRSFFLKFVDVLKQHADIFELATPTDYRLEKLAGRVIYLAPNNADTASQMDLIWEQMVDGADVVRTQLKVKSREIEVPKSAGTIARFSFAELCESPLGATDYLAITERYGTVFVDNIPVLGRERRNPTKRFIHLIDSFYDNGVKLICSAAAAPDQLYPSNKGPEYFEFQRTASRLIEMQSEDYLTSDRWQRKAA
ncbi:MAG: cell division protein ZapE [Pseudomonadota bacterium]